MAIIDRRSISLGGASKRSVSAIKNIAIHYSATAGGSTKAFENHWRNSLGWLTGGYHEVILLNGDVELNYNPNVISNGVGGQNSYIYNICYVGAGQPTSAQLKTLIERANYNRKRFNLPVNAVKGHREFPKQSTACPGVNMTTFRKQLGSGSTSDNSIKKLQQDLKKLGYNVGTIDGINGNMTKSAVRAFQKAEGLTVDGIAGKATKAEIKRILNGGLTMSQAKALEKRIKHLEEQNSILRKRVDNKVSKPKNQNVSDWAKKDWERAVKHQYFDGTNPQNSLTREQAAKVINTLVDNLVEHHIDPLKDK